MGYVESKVVGDRGEAIVAEVLKRYTTPEGIALHDLLFDGVDTTTQVDHILIDRFGLLLVETKFYNALIKGTSSDRMWTACYKNGTRRQFHNPLRQNEGHRDKLLRVLQQHDVRLDSSYTQSVIVFANGSIADLDLTPEDRARVLTAAEFDHHLATRSDFAPNSGDLDTSQIASIAAIIDSLDCSGDSVIEARHERMVKEASRRTRSRGRARRPTPDRAPRRPHAPRGSSKPAPKTVPPRVLLGLLMVAALFFGPRILANVLSAALNSLSATAVAPSIVAAPSVPDALARLREADPVVAQSLTNPNSPSLSTVGGYAAYTWEYIRKDAAQKASIQKLTVTFDQSGRIVGVSGD